MNSIPTHEFRITKYDPANRDRDGQYLMDDWTAFDDVKEGKIMLEDYQHVENAYISAARAILQDSGVKSMILTDVEISDHKASTPPTTVSVMDIELVLRPLLRGEYWAKLSAPGAFVHIGWDFYMYAGTDHVRPETLKQIEASGLFVEAFTSPYHETEANA